MIRSILSRFRRRPRGIDVVFIGDSLTEFWTAGDPRLFGAGIVNRGRSGETSDGMRARFEHDVIALSPRAVHIMGGTNDLWRGRPGPNAAATLGELTAMADMATGHGIRVILAAPPPIGPPAGDQFLHLALLAPLRDGIRAHCRARGHTFVDYAAVLGAERIRPAFTTDGVHLSARGYRAMRGHARAAIAAALA